jgi:hypothetical protein
MEDREVKVFATTTDFGEEYKGWWVADSVRRRVLEVTRLLLPMTVRKSYSVTVSWVDMVIGKCWFVPVLLWQQTNLHFALSLNPINPLDNNSELEESYWLNSPRHHE